MTMVEISLTPNHENALYKVGETATVIIVCDKPAKVTVSNDAGVVAMHELMAGNNTIPFTGGEPGFWLFKGEADGESAMCGIGFSPEKMSKQVAEPEDFDEFWQNAQAEAAKIPLDPQLEELPEFSTADFKAYRISFANINNTRIYGFLTVPNGDGPYPVYCSVPGAGPNDVRPLQKHNDKVITLVMNVFPFPLPATQEAANKLIYEVNYPGNVGYWQLDSDKLEDFFFYRAILGIDRAFTYVANHPKADKKHMVYWGSSQGGAMGVVMAALNPNLTAMVVNVPSDYSKIFIRSYAKDGNPLISKMPYFAGANFAERVKIPFMASAGMIDTGCTPTQITQFFNQIPGEKLIRYVPAMGHDFDPQYEEMTAEFIDKYLFD